MFLIENKPGIYSLTDLASKRFYVGSSKSVLRRLKTHIRELKRNCHHSAKLQNYYNLKPYVVMNVLEYVNNESCLISREQYWIDKLNAYKKGFNCSPTAGRTFGTKRSEEAKAKMRTAWTDERKAAHKAREKGKKLSPQMLETLAKGRETARLNGNSAKQRAAASATCKSRTGFRHTEEAKAKMTKTKLQRKLAKENSMPAFTFNASEHSPQYGGGGMLPIGKHPVMIVETELKPTKGGDGGYLALTMEAIDGPAKGGKQTDRLNLHNTNAMTVEIANKQLSAYCYVTGVFKFTDTNELCRRPFVVEIAPQKNKPEMTEVVAVYTSDMRKPAEVLASGNAPAQSAPIPPAQTADPSQASHAPTDAPAPSASLSNDAWGAAAGNQSEAAKAWGQGNANGPAPWANPGS